MPYLKKVSIFIFSFLLVFEVQQVCSSPIQKFNKLQHEENISLYSILEILEDKSGTIWIASLRGIYKFDGYSVEKFNYNHKDSITGALSLEFYKDKYVLIGTAKGLLIVDIETGDSKLHNKENHPKLSSQIVYSTMVYKEDLVILGTLYGVDTLNLKTNEVRNLLLYPKNKSSAGDYRTNTIRKDSKSESVWVGSYDGLFKLNPLKPHENLFSIREVNGQKLEVREVRDFDNNTMLVSSNLGLFKFDREKESLALYNTEFKELGIRSIYIDPNSQIWLGTEKKGMFILRNKEIIENFRLDRSSLYSVPDDTITAITPSSSGVIFVGTKNGGMGWYNPDTFQFSHFDQSRTELSCLDDSHITSISKTGSDEVVVSAKKKIATVNIAERKCDVIFDKLEDGATFYFKDSNNIEWIGTTDGIYKKKLAQKKFGLEKNFPKSVYFDYEILDNGDIYFGSIDSIWVLKNGKSNASRLYYNKREPLIFYQITNHEGKIIIGTFSGLYELDGNNLRPLDILSKEHKNKIIRKLTVDKNHNLWIGFHNSGLYQFDKKLELKKSYNNIEEIHALRGIYDFVEEGKGIFWFASENGLSRLDTESEIITNFHTMDGIQGEVFTTNSLQINNSGYLYAGGKKGINYFKPSQLIINSIPPKANLIRFLYFNSQVEVGDTYGNFTLKKHINFLEELILSHSDSSFGFEFSGVHLADPKRNQFAFKLEGYDKKWNYTDYKYRRAHYTNLPAGDYIFKVKAGSPHGTWSTPKELKLTIMPPFWLTIPAFFVYAILAILGIYSIVIYRTRSLTRRAKILEDSIQERTQELAKEKNKVEKLLSKKNDEFTNVSHEFRTPLTLILGPLKTFIQKYQDKVDTSELSVIERNSQRLLRMVNQMLNMETLKVNAITKRTPENFFSATELAVKAFSSVANEKDIQLTLIQKQEVCFDFTPDAYEKIILNLLSNAIKYTESHGEVIVTTERNKKNQFILTVKDNGIGIADDKQTSVFERFNRVINEDSERVTGAGIGLALVKDLVKAHDGRVELESELGEGTKVSVFLPIINEVEASQVDLHEDKELAAMELMALSESETQSDNNLSNLEDGSHKPSVLVIEDNADMRHYIESNINNIYQVLTAKNGDEGVKLAESEVPDLIISDIMMPKMNGYQVTRALRENQATSHIPIILLTAKSDLESRIRGWQENADEYLTKPFSIEELLIRLKNLLDIRDILKKRFADMAFSLADESSINKQPSNQEEDQHEFLIKLNNILDEIYKDSDVKIKDVSARIAMSDRQFHRKLKGIVDLSPNEYLRRYRLGKAKELLVQGKSANYAAFEVGFSSQSYFGRCFKALYGCSPSEINRQNPN